MNILFLTEKLEVKSGWGRYSVDLIETLQKSGHEVRVLCSQKSEEYSRILQYEVLPAALSMRHSYLFARWYARVARKVLKSSNFSPDVIHVLVEPYVRIAQKTARQNECSYVMTAHGSFAVRPLLLPLYRGFATRAYLQAKKIICISRYTEHQVRKYVPQAKTAIIPNGIKIPQSLNELKNNKKESLILTVGIFKERKGYFELLQALSLVREKVQNVQHVIVGNQADGVYVKKLNDFIEKTRLIGIVQFKQNLSDDELQALYDSAKVFALTPISRPDSFEGFGLVYLEANIRGVPVVGSYGNGGEDAIKDGENGFLVHVDNSQEIADRLVSLLTLPQEEYDQLAQKARIHALAYDWKDIGKLYEQVYMS